MNSVAGEDPLAGAYGWFWDADLTNTTKALENSLLSHIITAKHAAKLMMRARRGLIVEVTEGDSLGAGGNPVKQVVKLALKGNALAMAAELHPHGVAAVAITPGFLRSESMLEGFGVTEKNWRDGGKKDKNFLDVGIAALYRTRSRRARGRSEDHEAHRSAVQFVGAGAGIQVHRRRWDTARLGQAQDRFFGDATRFPGVLSHRRQT